MFNDRASKHTLDGWRAHTTVSGHTNHDSDDDYEIRCRQCDFVVHYSAEEHIELLESKVAELESYISKLEDKAAVTGWRKLYKESENK